MPDFTLLFRVGGRRANTVDQDPSFVAAKSVELLRAQAEKKGVERTAEGIFAARDDIVRDIAQDADRFGSQAARVFTKIRSPASGTITTALDGISRASAVSSTDSASSRLKGKTTVEWVALTKRTLENKRRRMVSSRRRRGAVSAGQPDTFFVDTGNLRKVLLDYFGPALASLVDPKIIVRRGPRKVTVSLSILAQASGKEKAGVSPQSLPGAYGDGGARSESLFVRYLKKVGAPDRDPKHPLLYKLENPHGTHRPFFQNTLIFWISNRLPIVLDKSLRKALSRRVKKVT
ncbi:MULTISPECIES: hypothetical protein [Methylobacterium]|uniref:Uncharacterized protein n=1 Tax=Methylobacterium jeotgali TaxID=381630 RepID=A0ABQ4SXQ4_9HYPH|nr:MULTISPECIES: hypothetical protein [Methylobacterium]PIU05301.1 MAG: hypothetical protein COT56_16060 [Methylobacterium sp. CG09_land_8_20_14_0_10_71_15]PIU12363.1 MAG: hypothetical protein COT28_15340 [Methylobacterium sp. CG08_land_8_20_14_0_20_71_15]GBU16875.1 hypothetical protein AwMethylo_10900 [Methylobacterium sp.]GJE07979.1 hypothetical protein AOPFMNJM_3311 [Methylobacterium jeotgali]